MFIIFYLFIYYYFKLLYFKFIYIDFYLARDQVKATFQASTLVNDGDFFYFIADSMAEGKLIN